MSTAQEEPAHLTHHKRTPKKIEKVRAVCQLLCSSVNQFRCEGAEGYHEQVEYCALGTIGCQKVAQLLAEKMSEEHDEVLDCKQGESDANVSSAISMPESRSVWLAHTSV